MWYMAHASLLLFMWLLLLYLRCPLRAPLLFCQCLMSMSVYVFVMHLRPGSIAVHSEEPDARGRSLCSCIQPRNSASLELSAMVILQILPFGVIRSDST